METLGFEGLNPNRLEAYAVQKADALGLTISSAFLPGVLECLAGIQQHAAILKAGLQTADPSLRGTENS